MHCHSWPVRNSSTPVVLVIASVGAVALAACAGAVVAERTPTPVAPSPSRPTDGLLHLDPTHDYGNRYADGILPVGDEHWSTSAAEVGTVFLCQDNFVSDEQAGAQTRGPWFVNDNTEWDVNLKSTIQGAVSWDSVLTMEISGSDRLIVTNDLPTHHTGQFPVANSDPARVFDANPNTITAQDLDYVLDAAPTPSEPTCMGGESGIMLTGVALFNGFDAGGRDAGAWEVQDDCDGHPQGAGEYHYHSLSRCIDDVSVSTVIGFALDGFPITGPVVSPGNLLTTIDLDACHGIVSTIELDGALVESYHYVMTQDFPYSISCFRGVAARAPAAEGGQDGQGGPPPLPPGNAPH